MLGSQVPEIATCPALTGTSMVGLLTLSFSKPPQVWQRSEIAVGHWLSTRALKAQVLQLAYSGASLLTPEISAIIPCIAQVADTLLTAANLRPLLVVIPNAAVS